MMRITPTRSVRQSGTFTVRGWNRAGWGSCVTDIEALDQVVFDAKDVIDHLIC